VEGEMHGPQHLVERDQAQDAQVVLPAERVL
jgi:hypothetical protein